jgi:hypothetical protein
MEVQTPTAPLNREKRKIRVRGDSELLQPLKLLLALLEQEKQQQSAVERARTKRLAKRYQVALYALMGLATEQEFAAMILVFPSHEISVPGIKACFSDQKRRHEAHQLMRQMSQRMFQLYYAQHDAQVEAGTKGDDPLVNKLRRI